MVEDGQPGGVSPSVVALGVLCDAIDGLAEVSPWRLSEGELLDLRRGLEVAGARLASVVLGVTRELDARGPLCDGASSAQAWLRAGLGLHPAAARAQVRLAAALRGELTATGAALAAGRVSVEHAHVIARVMGDLPPGVAPAVRRDAEAYLLTRAAEHDPRELSQLGRHLIHVLDPDAGDRLSSDEERAVAQRELFLGPDGRGGFLVRGRLDAEAGAALSAALDPLAAPRPAQDGTPDPRAAARRRADALIEVVGIAAAAGDLPAGGGALPTIVVTVDHATLRRDLGSAGGVLPGGEPLSAAAVRRLACDARIVPVVLGSASEPLDIGRATRTVPAGLRRALTVRDGGCAFPGCARPAPWCDAHHIQHWADGGPTRLNTSSWFATPTTAPCTPRHGPSPSTATGTRCSRPRPGPEHPPARDTLGDTTSPTGSDPPHHTANSKPKTPATPHE